MALRLSDMRDFSFVCLFFLFRTQAAIGASAIILGCSFIYVLCIEGMLIKGFFLFFKSKTA